MIVEAITAACNLAAKIFGYGQQRDAEKNTPVVQAGAERVNDQKAQDAVNTDLTKDDLKTIEQDIAE